MRVMRWIPLCALLALPALMGCYDRINADESPNLSDSALESPMPPEGTDPEGAQPAEAPVLPEPDALVAGVDHTYFPLTSGLVRVYEGVADGAHRRDEVRVTDRPCPVTGIDCTAVLQEVYLDGELAEVTTEWYAQDADGNVWKFGEESFEVVEGEYLATQDSWVAGEDGAEPWIFLAAQPEAGDRYVGLLPHGQETIEVMTVGETFTLPAGVYEQCLQVVESPEDPDDPNDTDLIIYAPGTGMVSEQSTTGRIDLVRQ